MAIVIDKCNRTSYVVESAFGTDTETFNENVALRQFATDNNAKTVSAGRGVVHVIIPDKLMPVALAMAEQMNWNGR